MRSTRRRRSSSREASHRSERDDRDLARRHRAAQQFAASEVGAERPGVDELRREDQHALLDHRAERLLRAAPVLALVARVNGDPAHDDELDRAQRHPGDQAGPAGSDTDPGDHERGDQPGDHVPAREVVVAHERKQERDADGSASVACVCRRIGSTAAPITAGAAIAASTARRRSSGTASSSRSGCVPSRFGRDRDRAARLSRRRPLRVTSRRHGGGVLVAYNPFLVWYRAEARSYAFSCRRWRSACTSSWPPHDLAGPEGAGSTARSPSSTRAASPRCPTTRAPCRRSPGERSRP